MKSCNKENMTKFVEALESGKYRQTQGALCRRKPRLDEYGDIINPIGNCCLGVATDLYLQKVGGKWTHDEDALYVLPNGTLNRRSVLPYPVKNWLGVSEENPSLTLYKNVKQTATYLNDEEEYDFIQIAQAFRRTYLDGNE